MSEDDRLFMSGAALWLQGGNALDRPSQKRLGPLIDAVLAERNAAQIVGSCAEACLTEALADLARLKEEAGWRMPEEPTREMWAAMGDVLVGYKNRHHDKVAADIYAAIRANLPAPPTADPRSGGVV